MRASWVLCLMSLLLACDQQPAPRPAAGSSASAAASAKPPAAVREFEPAPSWLVLQRHERTSPTGQLLAVKLPKSWPGEALVGRPMEVAAVTYRYSAKQFEILAAHSAGRIVFAAEHKDGAADGGDDAAASSWRLEQRRLDGNVDGGAAANAGSAVELGSLRPWALHLHGEHVYVGGRGSLGSIDLGAAAPTYKQVHRRADEPSKPYDLFVREGDRLIAIDDEVVPLYADLFRVKKDGSLQHRAAWDLPGIINGKYYLGDLARRGPEDDGTLLLIAGYGIMSGSGHDLLALPIVDEKLPFPEQFYVNSGGSRDDPQVLEEHLGTRTTVVAGSKLTRWQGLGVIAGTDQLGRIAIAAGDRGVMLVPFNFNSKTKAALTDVGGNCRDLLVHANIVYALVEVGEAASDAGASTHRGVLKVLRWEPPSLKEVAVVKLPGPYQRIVR